MGKIRWLHLSDFHVGKDDYAQRGMFDRIIEHAEDKCAEDFALDFLFVTGDLANRGLPEEYESFNRKFLIPLQTALGANLRARTFSVPGNHDVDRRKHSAFDRKEMVGAGSRYFDPTAEGQSHREILHPRFRAYCENDISIQKGQWVSSPAGAFAHVEEIAGIKIGIAGVNTAWLCKDDNDREQLTAGKGLLEEALKQLATCDVRIVLGHHPLDWFQPSERQMVSALLGKSAAIYLHGHLHEAWVSPAYGGGSGFLTVQCGAGFQARENEPWKNGLIWGEIDIQRGVLTLQAWTWNAGQQCWSLAADAFPDNHRVGDVWEYELPKSARRQVKPPPAPAIPPARPMEQPAAAAGGTDLLKRVLQLDDATLVRELLEGRWTLAQLEDVLQARPESALDIIRNVANKNGGPWLRMLGAFAASRVHVPPQELISIAFDPELYSWGSRFPPLACLRFMPHVEEDEVARRLTQTLEKHPLGKGNFDNERLVIYAFGFLGREYSVRSILDKNLAFQDKYANEKLGPFAVFAFLHVYLQLTNEGRERGTLDDLTEAILKTEALHNLTLGFFDYLDELQCLQPGKAVHLFRHLRDDRHWIPLMAVLKAISIRPNPLLLKELIEMGNQSYNAELGPHALHAASYIGTAAAEKHLRSCADQELPGARAAWLLAAGLSRKSAALDEVAATVRDQSLPRDASWLGDVRHNAIWAAGELGRGNAQFAKELLDPICEDPHDPYGRAQAWMGLAKAGVATAKTDFQAAFDNASNFFERSIIAAASAIAGWPHLLNDGIRSTIDNHAPLYRLIPHIERDVRTALQSHAGEGGKALVTLLDLGDFT